MAFFPTNQNLYSVVLATENNRTSDLTKKFPSTSPTSMIVNPLFPCKEVPGFLTMESWQYPTHKSTLNIILVEPCIQHQCPFGIKPPEMWQALSLPLHSKCRTSKKIIQAPSSWRIYSFWCWARWGENSTPCFSPSSPTDRPGWGSLLE